METTHILTTRTLRCPDQKGGEEDVVLTIFKPFEDEHGGWRCAFDFNPPIKPRNFRAGGVDAIQAFVYCVSTARLYLGTTGLSGRVHWQGMLDCGLPDLADRPTPLGWANVPPPEANPGNMPVLTTRRLGYRDDRGVETELLLTIFAPFEAEGETWKCGFTLGPPESATAQYGVGADFLEALLDSLSLARAVFESRLPKGWSRSASAELVDCVDLPYKIGRSFWTSPSSEWPVRTEPA